MILVRVGGPLWLGVIVTAWGVVAACFAGLASARGFYALRLLLGLAEAGTFPGLWVMLTQFYTTPEVRQTAPRLFVYRPTKPHLSLLAPAVQMLSHRED